MNLIHPLHKTQFATVSVINLSILPLHLNKLEPPLGETKGKKKSLKKRQHAIWVEHVLEGQGETMLAMEYISMKPQEKQFLMSVNNFQCLDLIDFFIYI